MYCPYCKNNMEFLYSFNRRDVSHRNLLHSVFYCNKCGLRSNEVVCRGVVLRVRFIKTSKNKRCQ